MKKVPKTKKGKQAKVEKVMHEGKMGRLHSGSKKGPIVKHGSAQEIAIALKQAGMSYKKKSKKKRDAAAALAK